MKSPLLCLLPLLCLSAHAATLPTGVQCKPFYDTASIHFAGPVWFGEYPAFPGAFLVAEYAGGLKLLEPQGAGYRSGPFADIATEPFAGNDGILGLAFHPDFKINRRYYVYYILHRGEAVLEERQAAASFRSDAGSGRILLRNIFQNVVHNGGDMHFGRDGFLYLGLGDAGNPNVYNNRSQDLRVFPGKMLRIDVDRRDPGLEYAIPADNPFAQDPDPLVKKEIYAYGLRQPWRWSFDALDGRLIAGDVGDWVQEEIDIVTKGANYGWSRMEGNTCFNGADEFSPLDNCDARGLTSPFAVIPHIPVSNAPTACIIGGYVFRGDPASPFFGAYVFGDWQTRKLYGVRMDAGTDSAIAQIGSIPDGPSTFGMDSRGNLYVAGYNSGVIYRLEHPALAGKGLAALRSSSQGFQPVRSSSGGWRVDRDAFPGAERVRILSLDGRVLRSYDPAALAAGTAVDLPRGLYVGESLAIGGLRAAPILVR